MWVPEQPRASIRSSACFRSEGHQPARSDLDNRGGVEVVSEIVNGTALPQLNQNSTHFGS
jgi:hypothetical protein